MNFKFIIGLGNPGDEYAETRHNAGFQILNAFANSLSSSEISLISIKKIKAKIIQISSQKVFLIYPKTYMNLSGQAVKALIDWYKITDLNSFVIIYDDISLPLGQIRWVTKGGAGGQHGIESIIEHLNGNKEFLRLKFGIGPDPGGEKRAAYVLSKFKADEKEVLKKTIRISVESLKLFLAGHSVPELMNKFNGLK